MKKPFVSRLTAVLLALLLFAGMMFPAFAAEQPKPEPTWQNVIEHITPIGDEPFVSLDLMPNGYIFTDYSIPREYDVTLKDGTTQRARIPRREVQDLYKDGRYIGHYFDVETTEETITLYALIYFDEENKQSFFKIGQVIFVPVEYEGEMYDDPYYHPISSEPCRTEIDDSSFLARLLYPIYAAFQKVIWYFEDLRDRLGL